MSIKGGQGAQAAIDGDITGGEDVVKLVVELKADVEQRGGSRMVLFAHSQRDERTAAFDLATDEVVQLNIRCALDASNMRCDMREVVLGYVGLETAALEGCDLSDGYKV